MYEPKAYLRKYYSSQTEPKWDQQKQAFEEKMNELKKIKDDYGLIKRNNSPTNEKYYSKDQFDETQMLLILKQQENESLAKQLQFEIQKNKDICEDLEKITGVCKDFENKLSFTKKQLDEKERVLGC